MMDVKKITAIIAFLVLLTGVTVPVTSAQTASQSTISDNLGRMSDLSTLNGLVKTAGLDSVLNGPGPYTLFAPTNTAMANIPSDRVNALESNKPMLGDLLKYHVVPGKITYGELTRMSELKTIDGKTLPVANKDGVLTVGGARVLSSGVDSKNGIIYPVNTVMMPPGFVLPQMSQSTGFSWGWLPWLIGGLLLAGIAYYLLSRRQKTREMPRGQYAKEPTERFETRPVEESKRAEETMRQVRESVSAAHEPSVADIARNVDLPLSGDSLKGLNMLLDKGTFKDKPDFMGFLAKTYLQNDLGSMMGVGGSALGVSTILGIINKTGIAKGFTEGDMKKYLVPLLMTGLMAIYKYMRSKPSAPDIQNIAKNIDLPLSGDALQGLNELIGMGTFKDKPDFLGFLAKTYMANDLGSTISNTNDLPVSTVMDIINKTGIGRGFMEGDMKKYLVPLLMTGFMAIYKYMTRRPAVKTA